MTVLLDTHTAIWYWEADPQLSRTAEAVISDPGNRKLVSTASPWEVAIKVSLGKMTLIGGYPGYFPGHMQRSGFDWLPPTHAHYCELTALPFYHRDPFDRLIIAQALWEDLPVVSADAQFDAYGVRRIW